MFLWFSDSGGGFVLFPFSYIFVWKGLKSEGGIRSAGKPEK